MNRHQGHISSHLAVSWNFEQCHFSTGGRAIKIANQPFQDVNDVKRTATVRRENTAFITSAGISSAIDSKPIKSFASQRLENEKRFLFSSNKGTLRNS